jgi:alcohol dehydrogenase YqhD (iron-dependent ADH family)
MENFEFCNPTRILFGRSAEEKVGEQVSLYSQKILLLFGGGSIKASGLYDKVTASLQKAGVSWIELGGVQPNPRLSLVYDGIKLCKEHRVGLILAVGGGSVIDSAKAIAMGGVIEGDVWDFFIGKGVPAKALPVATILTFPASGSEASTSSVITNERGWLKRSADSELLFPRFSILNPELSFTLPKFQVACGVADIMAHLMERYFTNVSHVVYTDRLLEASMKTLINEAQLVLDNSQDYDAWSEIMWVGTIAHNSLLNTGRVADWASHAIEHEISGIYNVAHGAGLAVVFPAWMKYVLKHDLNRFVQWSVRVWNVDMDVFNSEAVARAGISKMEAFFHSFGLGNKLVDLGIQDDRIDEMADKCTYGNTKTIGNFVELDREDIQKILRLAI